MPNPGQVILLVEDDDELREVMEAVLRDEGYTVTPAENGFRGLELARATPPGVILLDLMMPVMDGWEFRARQRADAALAMVPVIVVSAAGPDSLASLDPAAFIPKPFDFETLIRAVETYVPSGPAQT